MLALSSAVRVQVEGLFLDQVVAGHMALLQRAQVGLNAYGVVGEGVQKLVAGVEVRLHFINYKWPLQSLKFVRTTNRADWTTATSAGSSTTLEHGFPGSSLAVDTRSAPTA